MHHCEFSFHFFLVADFECFLRPPSAADNDEPNVDAFHVPSRFCFRVTDHELHHTDPVVYSSDNVMWKFFSHIFAEVKTISHILSCDVPMASLSARRIVQIASARFRKRIQRCGTTITSRANIYSRHVVTATWR